MIHLVFISKLADHLDIKKSSLKTLSETADLFIN